MLEQADRLELHISVNDDRRTHWSTLEAPVPLFQGNQTANSPLVLESRICDRPPATTQEFEDYATFQDLRQLHLLLTVRI